jgi:hypothetical protein
MIFHHKTFLFLHQGIAGNLSKERKWLHFHKLNMMIIMLALMKLMEVEPPFSDIFH